MEGMTLSAGEERAVRNAFVMRRRRLVLEFAEGLGSVKMACRELGVPRRTFYQWKRRFDEEGVRRALSGGAYPARSVADNVTDLEAQIAANHTGAAHLVHMAV